MTSIEIVDSDARGVMDARGVNLGCSGRTTWWMHGLVDARWRLRPKKMDDFSSWIEANFDLPDLVTAIRDIDIQFYTLEEIREAVSSQVGGYLRDPDEQTE